MNWYNLRVITAPWKVSASQGAFSSAVSTAAQVVLLWAALQYEAREARTRNASLKKESGPR